MAQFCPFYRVKNTIFFLSVSLLILKEVFFVSHSSSQTVQDHSSSIEVRRAMNLWSCFNLCFFPPSLLFHGFPEKRPIVRSSSRSPGASTLSVPRRESRRFAARTKGSIHSPPTGSSRRGPPIVQQYCSWPFPWPPRSRALLCFSTSAGTRRRPYSVKWDQPSKDKTQHSPRQVLTSPPPKQMTEPLWLIRNSLTFKNKNTKLLKLQIVLLLIKIFLSVSVNYHFFTILTHSIFFLRDLVYLFYFREYRCIFSFVLLVIQQTLIYLFFLDKKTHFFS